MGELGDLRRTWEGFSVFAFDANLLVFGIGPATAEAIRASAVLPAPDPAGAVDAAGAALAGGAAAGQ